MNRRYPLLTMCAIAATATCFTGTASAAPPNKTTITLTCDRETARASAHVELLNASGDVLAATDVVCDPSAGARSVRQVISTSAPATDAAVLPYDVATSAGATPCAGSGSLTFKLVCTDESGAGASLVVR
jgi:hypothetical protein